jgi:hypothetical protein
MGNGDPVAIYYTPYISYIYYIFNITNINYIYILQFAVLIFGLAIFYILPTVAVIFRTSHGITSCASDIRDTTYMSAIDENVLRLMFEGAPESWIVASIAKAETLQATLPTDHPLILAKAQQLMKLMPPAASADDARGSSGGSAYNEGGKSSANFSAPTGSNTTTDTKLDSDGSIQYDTSDDTGWPLVTPSMGYKSCSHQQQQHIWQQQQQQQQQQRQQQQWQQQPQ